MQYWSQHDPNARYPELETALAERRREFQGAGNSEDNEMLGERATFGNIGAVPETFLDTRQPTYDDAAIAPPRIDAGRCCPGVTQLGPRSY
jgi:hypothetical protein